MKASSVGGSFTSAQTRARPAVSQSRPAQPAAPRFDSPVFSALLSVQEVTNGRPLTEDETSKVIGLLDQAVGVQLTDGNAIAVMAKTVTGIGEKLAAASNTPAAIQCFKYALLALYAVPGESDAEAERLKAAIINDLSRLQSA